MLSASLQTESSNGRNTLKGSGDNSKMKNTQMTSKNCRITNGLCIKWFTADTFA